MLRFLLLALAGVVSAVEARPSWLLHLATDHDAYRRGDPVHLRVVVLDALRGTPVDEAPVQVALMRPDGTVHWRASAASADGVVGMRWPGDRGAPGGRWTLRAQTPRGAAVTRTLLVQDVEAPAFAVTVAFARQGLGAGETLTATLRARHVDGAPLAVPAAVAVRIGGREVQRATVALDADGAGLFSVVLPAPLPGDRGELTVAVEHGGRTERSVHALPLAVRPARADLHPEGGDLVAGLATRLYVQASTADGRPADIAGSIRDQDGAQVATLRTSHEGRGRCAFTPRAGASYRLHREDGTIDPLPAVRAAGAMLGSRLDLHAAGAPLALRVAATTAGAWRLRVGKRDQAVAKLAIDLAAGIARDVDVPLPDDVAGVLTATLSSPDGTPMAERLVVRAPARRLDIAVRSDRAQYAPGDEVELTITARDQDGRPAAAVLGVVVGDAGAQALVEPRERSPRLPVMALLDHEVADYADPAAYRDGPDAGAHLDLLLATQGWRRFLARADTTALIARHGDAARRVLAGTATDGVLPRLLPAEPGTRIVALSTRHDGSLPLAHVAGPAPQTTPRHPPVPEPPAPAQPGEPEFAVAIQERWLSRHQDPAGFWDPVAFVQHAPAGIARAAPGSWAGADAVRASTALALLAYLGAGYDHRMPSRYKLRVKRGLDWLLAAQDADGAWSADPSVHAACVAALAEAYAMTDDPALTAPTRRGIDVVLARQVVVDGQRLGWAATADEAPTCDSDASVWCVVALKSAAVAGLDVGQGLTGAQVYVRRAFAAANPDLARGVTASFPSRWRPTDNACFAPHAAPAGLWMAVLTGGKAGEAHIEGLADHVQGRFLPVAPPYDLLALYWCTLGIFQTGGERWTHWNEVWRDRLVAWQRTDRSWENGSWDSDRFAGFARHGGRLLSTVLAVLNLEIYYRYLPTRALGDPGVRPIREFAHAGRRADGVRGEATRTVCWHAALRTGADGLARVRFRTGDQLTAWRIAIDGHDAAGALGCADGQVVAGADLAVSVQAPRHLVSGDLLDAALAVRDRRPGRSGQVALAAVGGTAPAALALDDDGLAAATCRVVAGAPSTQTLRLTVGAAGKERAGDALERTIQVLAPGHAWQDGTGGALVGDGRAHAVIRVPADLVPGTLAASLVLHHEPASLASDALAALQREPHGCFEQCTAVTFPLVLAQRSLRARGDSDPALLARGRELLAKGYARLAGYACPEGGFEWYGKDPGHAVLTAIGLWQFRLLADEVAVDPAPIARARAWLLGQRDGDGRFRVERTAWSWPAASAQALICRCLLLAAADPAAEATTLRAGIDLVAAEAAASDDAYLIALAADVLLLAGRAEAGAAALARLRQNGEGRVIGGRGGIAGAAGPGCDVETTALAVRAWLRADPDGQRHGAAVTAATRFLAGACRGGAFGHTQATVLALDALDATERSVVGSRLARATVRLRVDDADAGALVVGGGERGARRFDLATLAPGAHRIELVQEGGGALPWTLALHGRRAEAEPRETPLALTTRLDAAVALGAVVDLGVRVANASAAVVGSPIAVVGVPAGLVPQAAALDALVRDGTIAAWELRDGAVALYWRELAVGGSVDLAVPCLAAFAGRFTGLPGWCRPYYQPERMAWTAGMAIAIRQ